MFWWVMEAEIPARWPFVVRKSSPGAPEGWDDGEVTAVPVLGPFLSRDEADTMRDGLEAAREVMEG